MITFCDKPQINFTVELSPKIFGAKNKLKLIALVLSKKDFAKWAEIGIKIINFQQKQGKSELTTGEFSELQKLVDKQLECLPDIIIGWEDVYDEKGEKLKFTRELFEHYCSLYPSIAQEILSTYANIITNPAKN